MICVPLFLSRVVVMMRFSFFFALFLVLAPMFPFGLVVASSRLFSFFALPRMLAVVGVVLVPTFFAFLPFFPVLFAPLGIIVRVRIRCHGGNRQRCKQQKRGYPSEILPHELLQPSSPGFALVLSGSQTLAT